MPTRITLCVLALSSFLPRLGAQEFKLFDREVQVHGFASQGFAYSGQNNYLTMNTSSGSGAFTDGGINMSTSLTNHLRGGAQVYLRNIGQLGSGHPDLDWAYLDYRFTDWFGIRVGKVKTVLGLYNDTQDDEFLHTWAILPQSTYPLDLRSATLAHTGADIYGHIAMGSKGDVNYTAYWGLRSFDKYGGIYFLSLDYGFPINRDSGHMEGGDMHWTTPISGLMVGASAVSLSENRTGHYLPLTGLTGSYATTSNPDYIMAGYAEYAHGRWHFAGEFRREFYLLRLTEASLPGGAVIYSGDSNRALFASASFRVFRRMTLGTYHSRFLVDHPDVAADPDSHHIYDQTVTTRFDVNRWWNLKIEGHFISGYGNLFSAHGFYLRSNPDGLHSKTNMLVLRSGISF